MKFIDWFAGIGGFRLGMEQAGHECVGFCEFDKFAVASYTSMHLLTDKQREYLQTLSLKQRQKEILKEEYKNGEWYASDVRRVDAGSVPAADCWCFGFPCQDISVAGKQKGFKGNRSSLFFAVTRLLGAIEEESRPKYLFIENVKNLLSVNRGYDFARLLVELDEIGYDAEWSVLNSKDFGVPQNRERVFIIGRLRGSGGRKVFPVSGTASQDSSKLELYGCIEGRNSQRGRIYSANGIAPTISTCPGENTEPKVAMPGFCDINYGAGLKLTENARCLQARYSKGVSGRGREVSGVVVPINPTGNMEMGVTCININNKDGKERPQQDRIYDANGQMTALSSQLGGRHNVAIPVLTPDRAEKRQNGRRFKENGEPMFTLTSQDRHGVMVENPRIWGGLQEHQTPRYDGVTPTLTSAMGMGGGQTPVLETGVRIRKLTPKECFRLQGWADDYFYKAQEVNSDSQLYKQAGNGVTVTVIHAIARKLNP